MSELLQNIQQIAEHNNFFDPGFRPSDMDDIPELYHRFIDDPAVLHDWFDRLQSRFRMFDGFPQSGGYYYDIRLCVCMCVCLSVTRITRSLRRILMKFLEGEMCGSVAEWLGSRTCDQQVAGSNPGRRGAKCNPGQVVYTHMSLSPSSII